MIPGRKDGNVFLDALQSLSDEDLLKPVLIRQETLTVIDAVNRQLAHYPYHIGQIIYIGKLIKDQNWKNLSIPRSKSDDYNKSGDIKDPARRY